MTWLFAILIVLAMGGVAVAASGRIGTMPEAYADRPDSVVPAGELRGDDLRRVRFSLGVRGYRMSEVDTLLERLAAQLDSQAAHRAHEQAEHDEGVDRDRRGDAATD